MKAAREFVGEMAEHISMPQVYVSIRALLLQPGSTIEDFVAVVEQDSMLSLRVMRLAGSEYFGFPRACGSLYQAISLIGLMQLHDLMLGSLCLRSFSTIPQQVFNLRAFWRYSVQCGIAARTVGQYSRVDSHHVFFTLGLLHEIGHAALFLKAPEISLQALVDSQEQERELDEVEREYFGFDYNDVGAELMQIWHLPPVYRQVAGHHLHPEQADNSYRSAVEVVHLAHEICQAPGSGRQEAVIKHSIDTRDVFRSLPPNLDELVSSEISKHCDTVLAMLWPQELQAVGPATEGHVRA